MQFTNTNNGFDAITATVTASGYTGGVGSNNVYVLPYSSSQLYVTPSLTNKVTVAGSMDVLSGNVYAGGVGVQGATVTLSDSIGSYFNITSIQTDKNGYFAAYFVPTSTFTGIDILTVSVAESTFSGSSSAISLQVNPYSSFRVTILPSSLTLDLGQSKILTASASGGSGVYSSYQWYINGITSSGQTSSTLNFSPSQTGAYSITATVTDNLGETCNQSSPMAVTANAARGTPTASAAKSSIDIGQSTTLTATAVSTGTSPYVYQWLKKGPSDSSWSIIAGATSTSYTFATTTSITSGTWYFELQVNDSATTAVTVTSNPVSVSVYSDPTVSISPSSASIDTTQSKTFTASGSGGSGSYTTYLWYVSGTAQTGQNASTFSFSTSTAGIFPITATVTDSLGITSNQSTPATITVINILPSG